MDIFLLTGFAGALLIVCAWAFEAFESVERHKSLIDLKFTLLYIFAMGLLLAHSAAIADIPFIFLNATVLCIALFEVAYTIYLHKVRRRK